jgi:hypothetical protein
MLQGQPPCKAARNMSDATSIFDPHSGGSAAVTADGAALSWLYSAHEVAGRLTACMDVEVRVTNQHIAIFASWTLTAACTDGSENVVKLPLTGARFNHSCSFLELQDCLILQCLSLHRLPGSSYLPKLSLS